MFAYFDSVLDEHGGQMLDSFGTYNKQNTPMAIIYKSEGKGSENFFFF